MKRIAVHIILFLFFHVFAAAQDHEYFQYTVKDGLPTNHVYGVMEDEDGNIWTYTENGMAKFDGYTFQIFNSKDGLPTNDIVQAMRDKDGRMWLWPFNGPPTYIYKDSIHVVADEYCGFIHRVNNQIRYYCRDKNYTLEMKNSVPTILDMKDDFFLDHKYLFPLDSVSYNPSGMSNDFFFITGDKMKRQKGDSLFIYSNLTGGRFLNLDDGYLFFNVLTGRVTRKRNGQNKNIELGVKLKTNESISIEEIGVKEKFIFHFLAQEKSLLIDFNKEKWKWITPSDSLLELQKVYLHTVSDSSFEIDGQNGFLSFDFDGELIDELRLRELSKQLFLQRFYKDRNQNIWIGSREGGVIMIPAGNRKTELLTSRFSMDQSFEQILKTKDGQLLAFTDNSGVYRINGKKITQLYAPQKGGRLMDVVDTKIGIILSSSNSSFLIPYQNGELVFPKEKVKIQARAKNRQEESELLSLIAGLKLLVFDSIHQKIYSTTSMHELCEYQLLSGKDIIYSRYSIPNPTAITYSAEQDQVYLGTNAGILSMKNEYMDTILRANDKIKNITSLDIIDGNLWIGNTTTGLYVYDHQNDSLKSILNASYIRRVHWDSDSTVLVCTNDGLFIVHTKTQKTIRHFTTKDGIPFNEIQDVYADGDRYIYIATTNGLVVLDRQMKTPVTLSTNDLKIDQIFINNQNIGAQKNYSFSYQENNLRLNYHLRSYASNGEIQYYSKLEPLQKEWKKSQEISTSYFGLNPGQYTFYLKAEDVYGNVVSLEEPLMIYIRKAIWQTYWFRILSLLLLLGGLIYFMIRREATQRVALEKEKQLNRRMATLELSALKAQMNPHFVFNALGAIQYYIQVHEVEAADAYLTRFAQLMRRFLDSSKEKLISLKDEVDLLTIYTDLEKMRFESLFSVDIIVDENVGLEDHYLPSMMIQPFIENAVNHGLSERRDGKGELIVFFYKKEDVLYCEVKDNGIGRENAKKAKRKGHHSRGMSIINEKIQTLKISGLADVNLDIQDLDPSNPKYPGTRIILTLKTIDDDEN